MNADFALPIRLPVVGWRRHGVNGNGSCCMRSVGALRVGWRVQYSGLRLRQPMVTVRRPSTTQRADEVILVTYILTGLLLTANRKVLYHSYAPI